MTSEPLGTVDPANDARIDALLADPAASPEAFAALVVSHLPASLYVLDVRHPKAAYTGEDVLRTLGYALPLPKPLTQAQVVHADDRAFAAAHLQDWHTWEQGSTYFVQRLRSPAGQWRWMAHRESILERDADGVPTQVVGVAEDITASYELGVVQEQERANHETASQALEEARHILGIVLGRAPLILWATDAQGFCTLFEGARLAGHGMMAGGLVGESMLEFLQHDAVAHATLLQALAGHAAIAKHRFCGAESYYETHYWPVLDTRGQVTGVIGLAFDISAEKQSRASSAHVARLQEMLDMQQAIVAAPLDTDALIATLVQRMLRNSPYRSGGVALMRDNELIVEGSIGPYVPDVGTRFDLYGTLTGTCVRLGAALISRNVQSDPRIKINLSQNARARSGVAVPIFGSSHVLGAIFAFSTAAGIDDPVYMKSLQLMANLLGSALVQAREFAARQDTISALRLNESALTQARNDALGAMRAKATFLANMSHEIRTPLNGIIGVGDLLADTPLSDQQSLYLQVMQASGHDLSRLINDILDFSKLESGGLEIEHIRFDMVRLVEAKAMLLQPQAESLKLKLSYHVDPALHHLVRGDPVRIGQVLLSLVNNATKFTSQGHIEIEVTAEPDEHVRFAVSDTGVGMSAREQAHLFEAFAQADRSSTRKYAGSGLGLAISKRLVELMGGRIGVQSVKEQGSIFWFIVPLPALREDSGEDTPDTEAASLDDGGDACPGASVLVVDDNSVNQLVATAILRALGYTPTAVASGREAVEAVLQKQYAAVLMDCQMPGMDGYEATRLIRATEMASGVHLPILALTASDLPSDQDACLKAGMDDWLVKPVEKVTLDKALRRCLRRG